MIKYYPLNKVCSEIVDCPHSTPDWKTEGIPVIRNFNLIDGQIDMSDGYYVDTKTYLERTKRAIPEAGDIIFSREAPIGNCGIVPEKFKCCLGQRLVLLKVNHDICSSKYLIAVLQSQFVKKQIEQIAKSGSIVSNFAIEDLKQLQIPILDNQEDVSSFYSLITEQVSNNKSMIDELESVSKLLYDYWFVQFDFPDENGKPYKSSGGKMVWNEELKRDIPDGWEVKPIDSLITQLSGFPFSSNDYVEHGKYKLYTIKNVQDGYIDDKVDNYLDSIPPRMDTGCLLSVGDMIMSLTGNVGRVGIVYETNALLNQRVLKLIPNVSSKMFVYQFLRSDEMQYRISQISVGTSQKNLSPIEFGSLLAIRPSEEVIERYKESCDIMYDKITELLQENQKLAFLRDFLLPMLMNGQVKIASKKE